MKKELTEEYVMHVAHLGRLKLTDEEIKKYKYQLNQILDEINKINDLDITSKDIMITPTINNNMFSTKELNTTDSKDILSNTPKTNGNYIEVRWLKND